MTLFHMLLGVLIYTLFGVRTTLSPCSDRANLRVDCNYVLFVSSLTGQSFKPFLATILDSAIFPPGIASRHYLYKIKVTIMQIQLSFLTKGFPILFRNC